LPDDYVVKVTRLLAASLCGWTTVELLEFTEAEAQAFEWCAREYRAHRNSQQ
jgi:hypothetical protein